MGTDRHLDVKSWISESCLKLPELLESSCLYLFSLVNARYYHFHFNHFNITPASNLKPHFCTTNLGIHCILMTYNIHAVMIFHLKVFKSQWRLLDDPKLRWWFHPPNNAKSSYCGVNSGQDVVGANFAIYCAGLKQIKTDILAVTSPQPSADMI